MSDISKHMFTHTGETPFLCKICGRKFTQSSSLNRHTLTHQGSGPRISLTDSSTSIEKTSASPHIDISPLEQLSYTTNLNENSELLCSETRGPCDEKNCHLDQKTVLQNNEKRIALAKTKYCKKIAKRTLNYHKSIVNAKGDSCHTKKSAILSPSAHSSCSNASSEIPELDDPEKEDLNSENYNTEHSKQKLRKGQKRNYVSEDHKRNIKDNINIKTVKRPGSKYSECNLKQVSEKNGFEDDLSIDSNTNLMSNGCKYMNMAPGNAEKDIHESEYTTISEELDHEKYVNKCSAVEELRATPFNTLLKRVIDVDFTSKIRQLDVHIQTDLFDFQRILSNFGKFAESLTISQQILLDFRINLIAPFGANTFHNTHLRSQENYSVLASFSITPISIDKPQYIATVGSGGRESSTSDSWCKSLVDAKNEHSYSTLKNIGTCLNKQKNQKKATQSDKLKKSKKCKKQKSRLGRKRRVNSKVQHLYTAFRKGQIKMRCLFCPHMIKNSYFAQHLRIHTTFKKFQCDICGKSCNHSSDLKKHIRVHERTTAYVCEVCGRKLSSSSSLVRHKRIHSGDRPYKCTFCGYGFRSKSDLTRHIKWYENRQLRKNETNMGRKPNRMMLKKHPMNIHEPFLCEVCGEAFHHRNSLKRHTFIHSQTSNYKCAMCDFIFRQKSDLVRHIRRIHLNSQKCRKIRQTRPRKLCAQLRRRALTQSYYHISSSGKIVKRSVQMTTLSQGKPKKDNKCPTSDSGTLTTKNNCTLGHSKISKMNCTSLVSLLSSLLESNDVPTVGKSKPPSRQLHLDQIEGTSVSDNSWEGLFPGASPVLCDICGLLLEDSGSLHYHQLFVHEEEYSSESIISPQTLSDVSHVLKICPNERHGTVVQVAEEILSPKVSFHELRKCRNLPPTTQTVLTNSSGTLPSEISSSTSSVPSSHELKSYMKVQSRLDHSENNSSLPVNVSFTIKDNKIPCFNIEPSEYDVILIDTTSLEK